MNLQEFLAKQEGIYENSFRKKVPTILEKGITPDPTLTRRDGGFFLFYRPFWKAQAISELSSRIAEIVPCVAYTPSMVHTTICTYGIETNMRPSVTNTHDSEIFAKLREANICLEHMLIPEVEYTNYLINETTVIARGIPDALFLMEVKLIVENARKVGLDVKMPWGAHTTIARFTEPVTDPEKLARLLTLVSETPGPGRTTLSVPRCGYFTAETNSFTINEC